MQLRRAGTARRARADELIAGDVIELQAGDAVPADCRLLEAAGLEVDESGLTGESVPVDKSVAPTAAQALADRRCTLYQGTVIAAGNAVGLVVATGERTEVGRTARRTGEEPPSSGVSVRLRSLMRTTRRSRWAPACAARYRPATRAADHPVAEQRSVPRRRGDSGGPALRRDRGRARRRPRAFRLGRAAAEVIERLLIRLGQALFVKPAVATA